MQRIFESNAGFVIPDNTIIYPFLNSRDAQQSGVPWSLLSGFSIARGVLAPRTTSKIHHLPLVEQVTYVVTGDLTATAKNPSDSRHWEIMVRRGQAFVTQRGALLQLANPTGDLVDLLYIVSPPYVFGPGPDGRPVYDDSILLEDSWETLEARNYSVEIGTDINELRAKREEAESRVRLQKEQQAES